LTLFGGKYISVFNAEEFQERIGVEFMHDCLPIAFDIKVDLAPDLAIDAAYGHPEVAGIKSGATTFTLSSEFASASMESSGIILLKLIPKPGGSVAAPAVKVSWRTPDRQEMTTRVAIPVRPAAGRRTPTQAVGEGYFSCPAIRKAVALTKYVKICDEYVMDDNHAAPAPTKIKTSKTWIDRMSKFKDHILNEMSAVGDKTLGGRNKNIMDTIEQIIDLESKELKTLTKELLGKKTMPEAKDGTPADYLCPITLRLMADPVIAADGHSYERNAIQEWFEHKRTSPKTNRSLSSLTLISNHTLKAAIQSHLSDESLKESKSAIPLPRHRDTKPILKMKKGPFKMKKGPFKVKKETMKVKKETLRAKAKPTQVGKRTGVKKRVTRSGARF